MSEDEDKTYVRPHVERALSEVMAFEGASYEDVSTVIFAALLEELSEVRYLLTKIVDSK